LTEICRIVFYLFAGLYLAALLLYLVAAFGLFGSTQGPLAGVFLVPLGLPWTLWIDRLFPETAWPWAAALAPLLNLGLIRLICRLTGRAGSA
jgi:hypothetical protein